MKRKSQFIRFTQILKNSYPRHWSWISCLGSKGYIRMFSSISIPKRCLSRVWWNWLRKFMNFTGSDKSIKRGIRQDNKGKESIEVTNLEEISQLHLINRIDKPNSNLNLKHSKLIWNKTHFHHGCTRISYQFKSKKWKWNSFWSTFSNLWTIFRTNMLVFSCSVTSFLALIILTPWTIFSLSEPCWSKSKGKRSLRKFRVMAVVRASCINSS